MNVVCLIDQFTPAQWSEICRPFADYSIYQSWAFGEVSAADTGSSVSRMVVRDASVVIGACQVRIKRIPLIRSGLAYVYYGPLGARTDRGLEQYAQVLNCVREEYARRRGLEVRIVPNLFVNQAKERQTQYFEESGFSACESEPSHRTVVVDLSADAEALRKNLAQKWRNGLNQAEKKGVRIEARTDDEAMQEFEALYDSMWSKKQFETGVAVPSFRRLQQQLPAEEKLIIHMAYKDGALAAGHVSSTLGDTCTYLLGASNDIGRDCKASYSLQWQAMLAAKNAGACQYDLGGIDPQANPGVYHFKSGLGGVETCFAGRFEAHSHGMGRFLVPMAERAFRTFSHLRKKKGKRNCVSSQSTADNARPTASCPTMAKLSS